MKKILILVMVMILAMLTLVSCDGIANAEWEQESKTNQMLSQMNQQVGMPEIKEFYEKKMMKEIYELRDNSKLICYVYTQGMNGKLIYIGKCMGFGVPYATQYTNPEKTTGSGTLPQADPNGLYMPTSSQATWVMIINEDTGKREIMYCEPNTVVTQSKMPKRICETWSLPTDY